MIMLRCCPICNKSIEDTTLFLEEHIDQALFSEFSYASRKAPEYMCYRLVKCKFCDLVYASNPPDQKQLAQAYHSADYNSSAEADDAAKTYMNIMEPVLANLKQKVSVLEIGSGTGVLLEFLSNEGFTHLVGIEPSAKAIANAPIHRREWLQEGIFEEASYLPETFDLICCFMTLEHVYDPMALAMAAHRLLKPGGAFVTVTHDYAGWINRALGRKSPIIDIEHLQLFSKSSINRLFRCSGFSAISVKPFVNRYSLNYWLRLTPLPNFIKCSFSYLDSQCNIGKIKIAINVGNIVATGFKSSQ